MNATWRERDHLVLTIVTSLLHEHGILGSYARDEHYDLLHPRSREKDPENRLGRYKISVG